MDNHNLCFVHGGTRNGPHLHIEPSPACELNYEGFALFFFSLKYQEKAVPTTRYKIRWASGLIFFEEWMVYSHGCNG